MFHEVRGDTTSELDGNSLLQLGSLLCHLHLSFSHLLSQTEVVAQDALQKPEVDFLQLGALVSLKLVSQILLLFHHVIVFVAVVCVRR